MTRAPIPSEPTGLALRTGINARFKQLYDAASFTLTSVGGTANAVTATLVPALDGDGLLDGMTFTIVWDAANTGGVTLAINGGSPIPVLAYDGTALTDGALGAGLVSRLTYFGGDFILTSPSLLMGGSGAGSFYFAFTSSGTFTKPDGLPDDRRVFVEAWGGGGGGGAALACGGGGAYAPAWFRAADLGATVTVTIGAGGAVGVSGGNTTFGALLTAYGGGASAADDFQGGGGGGTHQKGGDGFISTPGAAGFQGGGAGGGAAGNDATTENGGGGGAGGSGIGGRAVRGGGGGGVSAGGVSLFAGNGGADGVAGSAPAGGGGRGAAGARGELRIWI
jgi:hypothetical protein